LDLVSTLGKAAHFPNENHEMLQGLLMKYRTELGHLQDKALERYDSRDAQASKDADITLARLPRLARKHRLT
jgi:hypothetical protein